MTALTVFFVHGSSSAPQSLNPPAARWLAASGFPCYETAWVRLSGMTVRDPGRADPGQFAAGD